ncbi:MAG: 23S rRNA (pseudouridine(1915)-N(3))-methyltransferase RlmH [Alphaproteobacteria bacterium]|jgi:23S rRNA (pseudouridine1915-N3)-methyltransferase
MRLVVLAIGRLKAGPERDLVARYRERMVKAARALGFRSLDLLEFDESRAADADRRKSDEATLIRKATVGRLVLFDERGDALTSQAFAKQLGTWRDGGEEAVTFALGGPDGLDAALRKEAALVLSFGAMTLPHQLARVLVLEQLYRATTILSGHPYHRD